MYIPSIHLLSYCMGLPLAVSDLEQVLNSWFKAGRRAGWRMLRRFCWSLSVLLELTGEREKGLVSNTDWEKSEEWEECSVHHWSWDFSLINTNQKSNSTPLGSHDSRVPYVLEQWEGHYELELEVKRWLVQGSSHVTTPRIGTHIADHLRRVASRSSQLWEILLWIQSAL